MTLRVRVRIGAALLIMLLCAGALLASWRIERIRIGGPIQVRLQQASDLIADILPPPEYVIESYLEATLLVQDAGAYAERTAKLKKLHADYDARHDYWLDADLDPALKHAITDRTHRPALRFWTELETGLLPAIRAGERAAVAASYRRLTAAYAVHRRMVDETVVQAAAYQGKLNRIAAGELRLGIVILLALALAIIAVALGSAVYLSRRFVGPLGEMAAATTILAQGGSCAVPHLGRPDELGTLADAVDSFRRAAAERQEADKRATAEQQAVANILARALQAMATGDLTGTRGGHFPTSYATIGRNLDTTVLRLREMIDAVAESAGQIGGAATEITTAASDLADRTRGNAVELEQAATSLGTIDLSSRNTTQLSRDAADRTGATVRAVGVGRDGARGAVAAMERVATSARGIDEVMEALDKIAFQTRVLAMNAAIEAGRGGDAGRGFAIVADLVGALAIRAEAEARQARERLTVTQRDIDLAVGAVADVDSALVAIAREIDQVQTMLGAIATDNRVQSEAFSEVTGTVGRLDLSTRQNAAMVERTMAAACRLAQEVGALGDRTGAFETGRRAGLTPRPASIAA